MNGGRWREPLQELGPDVLDRHRRDVPLREDDERRALRFPGHISGLQVAFDDPLARVDQDERDVGALGRLERAQLRVVVDPLALLALAPQARGVDERERAARRARSACRSSRASYRGLRDDRALGADQRVVERRLADVRPAEDRDPDRLVASPSAATADVLEPRRRSRRAGRPCRGRAGRRAASGSPRPSRWRSRASASCAGRRSCSRARAPACRRRAGSRRAPRRRRWSPARASTRKSTRSASLDRGSRLVGDRARDRVLAAMSTPPVSISRNCLPAQSQRAPCGRGSCRASRGRRRRGTEVRRLISVDLPTFGKPTIATVPSRSRIAVGAACRS